MSAEVWLPVVGYEGLYEVSDHGRVRSMDRITHDGKSLSGQIIKPYQMPSGHLRLGLCRYGKKSTFKVHRLVLFAFVGSPPPGMEALHGDGDPSNNSLANLKWGTKSENVQDQIRHGVHPEARKTHCPAGHPYDATNTYFHPCSRHRQCRTCVRTQNRAAYQLRRAAA